MATYHQPLTIKAGESCSEPLALKPHGRVVGVTTVGNWDDRFVIGMDIDIDGKDSWFAVRDGIKGERAHIKGMKANSFHVTPDYGHPLSEIQDDRVRFVALVGDAMDTFRNVPQEEDRVLDICIQVG